jgi:hypothetical protein
VGVWLSLANAGIATPGVASAARIAATARVLGLVIMVILFPVYATKSRFDIDPCASAAWVDRTEPFGQNRKPRRDFKVTEPFGHNQLIAMWYLTTFQGKGIGCSLKHVCSC